MKKVLVATMLSLMVASSAMAADTTYTGSLLNSFQKKINDTAAPVVNKEQQIRAQQQALSPQNKVNSAQAQQQALINKKKQQIDAQKNLLNNEKNELKGIFSVK